MDVSVNGTDFRVITHCDEDLAQQSNDLQAL